MCDGLEKGRLVLESRLLKTWNTLSRLCHGGWIRQHNICGQIQWTKNRQLQSSRNQYFLPPTWYVLSLLLTCRSLWTCYFVECCWATDSILSLRHSYIIHQRFNAAYEVRAVVQAVTLGHWLLVSAGEPRSLAGSPLVHCEVRAVVQVVTKMVTDSGI